MFAEFNTYFLKVIEREKQTTRKRDNETVVKAEYSESRGPGFRIPSPLNGYHDFAPNMTRLTSVRLKRQIVARKKGTFRLAHCHLVKVSVLELVILTTNCSFKNDGS